MFDQDAFYRFIVGNEVVGFFEEPVKLKSGRLSSWYVNWRIVAEDAFLMDKLSDFVLGFVKDKSIEVDTFYGVPEGGTKLGVITQYKHAKMDPNLGKGKYVLAMGRGKPKEHGMVRDRQFLGVPKGDVVVLEDVVTTGGSMLAHVRSLLEVGVGISAVIALTDRDEKRDDGKHVSQILRDMHVPYYAMSRARDLLPRLNIPDKVRERIVDEFNRFGITRIRL